MAGWAEGELATTEIAYQYDELSRLTEVNYSDGTYFHYGYDANGNRLSETTAAGAVESVYDVANRLTSVGGVAYTWDANGNLTADGTRTYAYDSANRLKSVSEDGAAVGSYQYNGLGDRLVENETQFVMDLNSGLTQALQAGAYSYLYGSGRIGQFSGAESAFFLGDALGSVRQLVDGDGEVTLVQSYEPYGEVLESTGDGETNYTYTGEWNSASNNLVYLRTRFYDPVIGRFLTKDRWQGNKLLPMSYNQWLYGYENPVVITDPSGMRPVCPPGDCGCPLDGKEPTKSITDLTPIIRGQYSPSVYETYQVLRDDVRGWWNNYTLRTLTPIDFLWIILAHEFRGIDADGKLLAETIVRNYHDKESSYSQFGMTSEFGTVQGIMVFIAAHEMITYDDGNGNVRNWLISRKEPLARKTQLANLYYARDAKANLNIEMFLYLKSPLPAWSIKDNDAPSDWGNPAMVPVSRKDKFLGVSEGPNKDNVIYRSDANSRVPDPNFFFIWSLNQVKFWKN